MSEKIFWSLIGLICLIAQSFFLSLGLTVIWAFIFSWKVKEPWLFLFGLGLLTDIFYLTPIGKTALIYLGVGLISKYLKTVFGFRESYKMKVNRF